jgi:hypothetical protein
MSIFIVSAVMHGGNGVSKLVHGTSTKESSETAIGSSTILWLKQYPGFALENIICTELTDYVYKPVENISTENVKSEPENDNESKNETQT